MACFRIRTKREKVRQKTEDQDDDDDDDDDDDADEAERNEWTERGSGTIVSQPAAFSRANQSVT